MPPPIGHVEDGVMHAVKTADTPDQIERLRREESVLSRIRHPGVVELVATGGSQPDGSYRLATKHAGTVTLADPRPLDAAEIAGVMASVASTLADIHTLGVAHTRLTLRRVILGAEGQTSICGWADATISDDADPVWRLAAADDVEAIGTMIGELLDRATKPGPRRRLLFNDSASSPASQLRTISHHATDSEPTRRPTMRALANRLATAVPDAHLPGTVPTAPPELIGDQALPALEASVVLPANPSDAGGDGVARVDVERPAAVRSRRLPLAVAILMLAIAAGVGLVALWPSAEPQTRVAISATSTIAPAIEADATTSSTTVSPTTVLPTAVSPTAVAPTRAPENTTTTSGPTTTTTSRPLTTTSTSPALAPAPPTTIIAPAPTTTGPDAAPPTTAPLACTIGREDEPDIDGDGCPDRVVIDGNTVAIGSLVLEIGAEGGQLQLGDWNCDGRDTPAAFHPATGLVAVFDAWATRETPVDARIVAEEIGATEFGVRRGADDTCDELTLRTRNGSLITIDPMADFVPLNK